ncbi:MAG: dicarboxylate/amino acid:cation symporter [Phycisphaeraceae bacterium]|nr:dicarboxylate/amino acid:cation symporter [Phycisphaeraceae bacterium]
MRIALHWKIVIGLIAGILVGLLLNSFGPAIQAAAGDTGPAAGTIRFLTQLNDFVGALFIRALRFIAVPVVFTSLIVGAAGLGDLRRLGRIGGKTFGLYLGTTAFAVVLGLVLANVIKPGSFVGESARTAQFAANEATVAASVENISKVKSLWQQALDVVPENPFGALAQGEMLQIIVFALVIGIGLTMIPRDKAAPVIAFFDALTDVIIKIVHLVMRLAPVAVFALVVPKVATLGLDVLAALGAFCLVVVLGLAILTFVEYPLLLWLLGRMSYGRFFKAMAPAQVLAFSSSSSAATLPVTMDCVQNRIGVSERITSFVCPLGTTINMDGTALFQGVAVLFIAQLYGISLDVGAQISIVLLATLSSIGSPGVPSGGTVMLLLVLKQVGLPAEGIAVVLGVDRILDMCRTVTNVTGDGMTAVIIARSEGEEIEPPASE